MPSPRDGDINDDRAGEQAVTQIKSLGLVIDAIIGISRIDEVVDDTLPIMQQPNSEFKE